MTTITYTATRNPQRPQSWSPKIFHWINWRKSWEMIENRHEFEIYCKICRITLKMPSVTNICTWRQNIYKYHKQCLHVLHTAWHTNYYCNQCSQLILLNVTDKNQTHLLKLTIAYEQPNYTIHCLLCDNTTLKLNCRQIKHWPQIPVLKLLAIIITSYSRPTFQSGRKDPSLIIILLPYFAWLIFSTCNHTKLSQKLYTYNVNIAK